MQHAAPGKILISQQCYNTLKSKVNNFGFYEQKIDVSGQAQTCYNLHKRKNMKRLEKKERLRDAVVEPDDRKVPQETQYNPFKPIGLSNGNTEETNTAKQQQPVER